MSILASGSLNMHEGQKTVLVIDDEEAIREAVTDILEIGGMRTLRAANGRDGLLMFQERYEEISAVLLDMNMPILRGDQILPILRLVDPTIKIIISSGYTDVDIGATLNRGDADAYLPKPYNLTQLLETVDALI